MKIFVISQVGALKLYRGRCSASYRVESRYAICTDAEVEHMNILVNRIVRVILFPLHPSTSSLPHLTFDFGMLGHVL